MTTSRLRARLANSLEAVQRRVGQHEVVPADAGHDAPGEVLQAGCVLGAGPGAQVLHAQRVTGGHGLEARRSGRPADLLGREAEVLGHLGRVHALGAAVEGGSPQVGPVDRGRRIDIEQHGHVVAPRRLPAAPADEDDWCGQCRRRRPVASGRRVGKGAHGADATFGERLDGAGDESGATEAGVAHGDPSHGERVFVGAEAAEVERDHGPPDAASRPATARLRPDEPGFSRR